MPVHDFNSSGNAADFTSAFQSGRTDTQRDNSPLSIYNSERNDIALARSQAEEQMALVGAETLIFTRTNNGDYDRVFDEDPNPTYDVPVGIRGFWKFESIQTELAKWGVDTSIKLDINYTHMSIFAQFGERMLRPGDVIQIPYGSVPITPKNFRILNSTPSGNYHYAWMYFTCQVEQLTADITVRVEDDMPEVDPYEDGGGVYRESI